MSALEIVAIIVLCVLGLCMVSLWGQTTLLINRILKQYEEEKKPASEIEAEMTELINFIESNSEVHRD